MRATSLALATMLLFTSASVAQGTQPLLQNPNTNGLPGHWLPAFGHGPHNVGAACTAYNYPTNVQRFIPIHAALIPKGQFQGCVLMWEVGRQHECFVGFPGTSNPTSLPTGQIDVRGTILDPRTTPPTLHKFAWRLQVADASASPGAPWCTNPPPGYQGLFCAGHCWLPDGRLLVAGGDYWPPIVCGGADFVGSRNVLVFDPDDVDITMPFQQANGPGLGKPWRSLKQTVGSQPQADLHYPRWYPTCTVVAPKVMGANPLVYIVVAGGLETYDEGLPTLTPPGDRAFDTQEVLVLELGNGRITHDTRNPAGVQPWVYDGPTTPLAGGASFFYYPRMFALSERSVPNPSSTNPDYPDGVLWMAAMSAQSAKSDIVNTPTSWPNEQNPIPLAPGKDLLEEPPAVLFPAVSPGYRDSILVIGGAQISSTLTSHGQGIATSECWLIDTRSLEAVS